MLDVRAVEAGHGVAPRQLATARLERGRVDREIAALNWRHLRHRGPTDVIAFGFAPAARGGPVVGDVYIAPAVARRNAAEHGRGVREETLRLVVHGVLHVLGYDHPAGESRYESPMWRRQERLLRSALAAA